VENLDDLHAAEMVQWETDVVEVGMLRLRRKDLAVLSSSLSMTVQGFLNRDGGLVFLVGAFEVGDFVVAFEVPDAGGDFVDEVVIVGYEENCAVIALQGNI
jgi:hypothetical protein